MGQRPSRHDSCVPGQVAVLVHPGDVVVMAGGSMRTTQHGTHRVEEWQELHEQNWRCIDFHDDKQRTVDPMKTDRYSIALRCNRYHEGDCPRSDNARPKYGKVDLPRMQVCTPNAPHIVIRRPKRRPPIRDCNQPLAGSHLGGSLQHRGSFMSYIFDACKCLRLC